VLVVTTLLLFEILEAVMLAVCMLMWVTSFSSTKPMITRVFSQLILQRFWICLTMVSF